eukprot:CAMPEP_0114257050 /NCGR_PEP_ID=MMETSP0058-20121206/18507_1 /TAXON_ID=36894 /ORGANISM="Pyramimonas parkeae, CCMP726" /LENGTH=247 /DNA_ID=CAMNT_0001371713 /DNA_START=28 /DNA_END=771 /DNA_ORIENTATION=-
MTSNNSKIHAELFFDVGSPYSWIALEILLRYRSVWNMDLKLKPVLAGAVHKAASNQPPGMVPAKGLHNLEDLKRNVAYIGVPIVAPLASFMTKDFNTVPMMRLVIAALLSKDVSVDDSVTLTRSLYRGVWGRACGKDVLITDKEFLMNRCKDAGLSDGAASLLLAASTSSTVKQELKANTERAIGLGAYGVPWIVIPASEFVMQESVQSKNVVATGHVTFFGSDRFEQIAYLLGKPWLGPNITPARL